MPYQDHTPELTAQEVLRHAQELLEEKLPLNAEGYKGTMDNLFKVLLGVAAKPAPLVTGARRIFTQPRTEHGKV